MHAARQREAARKTPRLRDRAAMVGRGGCACRECARTGARAAGSSVAWREHRCACSERVAGAARRRRSADLAELGLEGRKHRGPQHQLDVAWSGARPAAIASHRIDGTSPRGHQASASVASTCLRTSASAARALAAAWSPPPSDGTLGSGSRLARQAWHQLASAPPPEEPEQKVPRGPPRRPVQVLLGGKKAWFTRTGTRRAQEGGMVLPARAERCRCEAPSAA